LEDDNYATEIKCKQPTIFRKSTVINTVRTDIYPEKCIPIDIHRHDSVPHQLRSTHPTRHFLALFLSNDFPPDAIHRSHERMGHAVSPFRFHFIWASRHSVDYLRDVVHKRLQTLTYLRSIHMGRTHWINTILPTKQDLERVFSNEAMRKRSYQFAVLGMSLSNTFDIQPSQDFLRAIINTLVDFDQFQDGIDKSRIRFFRGKPPKKGGGNDFAMPLPDPGETSYLMAPHIPYYLNYHQTLISLIDVISEVYQKISSLLGFSPFPASSQMGPLGMITPYPGISYLFSGDETARDGEESLLGIALGTGGAATFGGHTSPSSWNPLWADMVNKIDTKLKKTITLLTKELDTFARNQIRDELASLDPLLRNVTIHDLGREQYDFDGTV